MPIKDLPPYATHETIVVLTADSDEDDEKMPKIGLVKIFFFDGRC